MSKKITKIIKLIFFIALIAVAILFVIYRINQYEKEGEKDMPFYLDKILIMSTVDGTKNENSTNIWDIQLKENNDIYVYTKKREDTDENLKEIRIENFVIEKAPQKGTLKVYRPTGELSNLYTESEQDYIKENITYTAGAIDDPKTLTVSNTGGIMCFRISLEDIGNYASNEETEIIYNGTLLSKADVKIEELDFTISFDIVITLKSGVSFKGTTRFTLPGNQLFEEGTEKIEITDFSDVIFKRINQKG